MVQACGCAWGEGQLRALPEPLAPCRAASQRQTPHGELLVPVRRESEGGGSRPGHVSRIASDLTAGPQVGAEPNTVPGPRRREMTVSPAT